MHRLNAVAGTRRERRFNLLRELLRRRRFARACQAKLAELFPEPFKAGEKAAVGSQRVLALGRIGSSRLLKRREAHLHALWSTHKRDCVRLPTPSFRMGDSAPIEAETQRESQRRNDLIQLAPWRSSGCRTPNF